jgi:hypothetical protein
MRFATRVILLIAILTFGVRQGGNPDADTLALELQTEVVMTVGGPAILPVFVPRKLAHKCSLPSVNSRANETQRQIIAAIANRAVKCAVENLVAKPIQRKGVVR